MNEEVAQSDEQQTEIELARSHLIAYMMMAHETYIPADHLILIASELEKVERGETPRLMIFAPPRHGKSLTTSKGFPAWCMGRRPKRDFIFASYAQDIADDCGRGVQTFFETDAHKAIFPASRISPDSTSVRRFHTTQGGGFFAAGVGGPLTGRGGHIRIIDDPYKNRSEADSETTNRVLREWYTSTFYTRGQVDFELVEKGYPASAEFAPIVLIMTRWTNRGLENYLLDTQAEQEQLPDFDPRLKWKIISLPAEAEDEDDLLGRERGEALWPEAFNTKLLRQIQRDVGARDYNSLYQQRPADIEGDIFKRQSWRFYNELPEDVDFWIQSWDTSFKDTKTSDFVVGIVMAARGPDIFVIDLVRDRMNLFRCMEEITAMSLRYPKTYKKVVENKANGPAIIAKMQETLSGVVPGNPDIVGNKLQRWNAAAPSVESGHVYLPKKAPWVDAFIDELATVPSAKYDDQADAFAQGVLTLHGDRTAGLIEFYKRKCEAILQGKSIMAPTREQTERITQERKGWSNAY